MKKLKKLTALASQTVVMQPEQKPMQKYTPEKAKEAALNSTQILWDINYTLKEVGESILPKFVQGTEKERKEVEDELNKRIYSIVMGFEVETHAALMEAFSSQYRGMAKELSSQIIKEYSCTTHIEKMLAEVVVGAFIRFIDNSRRLNNELECTTINENRTKYITILSKQADRSHRQYLNSLAMLQQIKAPTIQMNIKTNTAFVTQTQQFNVPQVPNENNEPK